MKNKYFPDFSSLKRYEDKRFYFKDGTELKPLFQEGYDSPEDFKDAGVRGYEPMTAKEITKDEEVERLLQSDECIIEEKLDGTRSLVHFYSQLEEVDNGTERPFGYARVFSRRISKKTGFYVENSDSVPQIRDIDVPTMDGTVLDGEMFIPDKPFKEVSGTLNCLWDEAVERQIKNGFICLNAFDILFYKGIDLRNHPLHRRKKYLSRAIKELNSPYINEIPHFSCGDRIEVIVSNEQVHNILESKKGVYPQLVEDTNESIEPVDFATKNVESLRALPLYLTPKGYYEFIVLSGGEGVIIKDVNGKYLHKRGREYQKIKKFLTRDLIIMGFSEPTHEYTGKFPKDRWNYWESSEHPEKRLDEMYASETSAKELKKMGWNPINRFAYYRTVGNLILGVTITDEEIEALPKKKKFNIKTMSLEGEAVNVIEVCECAGFDDAQREDFSFTYIEPHSRTFATYQMAMDKSHLDKNLEKYDWKGEVVEVMANEQFNDTGKLRHPRFMRLRRDKSPLQCTWLDHFE